MKAAQDQFKKIPWGSLICTTIAYGLIGRYFAEKYAPESTLFFTIMAAILGAMMGVAFGLDQRNRKEAKKMAAKQKAEDI